MIVWRLDRKRIPDLRLSLGLLIPVLAGVALFGWRAAGVMGLVIIGALAARVFLNRTPSMPRRLGRLSLLVQSVLLSLFLPSTLFDVDRALLGVEARWPLAVALGACLTLLTWLIARLGTARAHPLTISLMVAIALAPKMLETDHVLTRQHLVTGDILDDRVEYRPTNTAEPWLAAQSPEVVFRVPAASKRLDDFLRAQVTPERPVSTIARLISDDLPPLEDLVIGGHPRRIGQASGIAILIGGLFLVHRRIVAFRVPLLMLIATVTVVILAPVPIVVSDQEVVYRWLASNDPRVGWAAGITFANYLLLASPTLLVTFFLASLPGVRPLGGRAVMRYSILFGVLCGVMTTLVSVEHGPILALALAQIAAPTLERYR